MYEEFLVKIIAMYPARIDEKNIDRISALNSNFKTHINSFVFFKVNIIL